MLKLLKSRVLDVEKVYAPLNFGVQERVRYGPFFWLWTILKKVITGTFRLFCAFLKASATVKTSSFIFGKFIYPSIFNDDFN